MELTRQLGAEPLSTSFELARYRLPDETRILVADRLDGALVISDQPAYGVGQSHLVDSGIPWGPQLFALVEDYLAQAARHGRCPMAASAIDLHDSSHPREAIS